jgi:hypothetical protein
MSTVKTLTAYIKTKRFLLIRDDIEQCLIALRTQSVSKEILDAVKVTMLKNTDTVVNKPTMSQSNAKKRPPSSELGNPMQSNPSNDDTAHQKLCVFCPRKKVRTVSIDHDSIDTQHALNEVENSETRKPAGQFLVANYNSVDADQAHGGTQIQDIITNAYRTEGYKSPVAFRELLRPFRFKDNSKFKHCLDLFDAVATDEQCEILGKPGLDKTALQGVANAIADACMDQLDNWEGNVKRGKQKKGYAGVGTRVSGLKTKFQNDYGSICLKNALKNALNHALH